jgi:D-3-phosphoglycerate dehydrogenase
MKILVTDGLAATGMQRLQAQATVVSTSGLDPETLRAAIADVDAVIVRSRTRIDRAAIAAASRLRVIARAGVGVDNIDMEAATRRGILVLTTPESSTVSTAEHTMAMLLASARDLPAAHAATAQGSWERERFLGTELYGKTLGIIGLGKIGSEVARRATAFGMRVIGFDPYVSADRAARLGVELLSLDVMLERSDFLTLHLPLSARTRHLLGPAQLAQVRPGVRIINCARGGLIDEVALLAALEDGRVAGAALDVFEQEPPLGSPLVRHPRVIVTPHLGASTEEAQRGIGIEVAEQVLAALAGRPAKGAVNAPVLLAEDWQRLRPFGDLLHTLGAVAHQLVSGQVTGVEIFYEGQIAAEQTQSLSASLLVGLLAPILDQPVNLVNAAILAKERGINLSEVRRDHSEDFSSLIRVQLDTTHGPLLVGGTLFGHREPRITHLDGYRIDLVPSARMLFVWNVDRPGMIGRVGSILGSQHVNIAGMQVGRTAPGGTAVMVLTIDTPVPEAAIQEIARVDGITAVKVVELGSGRDAASPSEGGPPRSEKWVDAQTAGRLGEPRREGVS